MSEALDASVYRISTYSALVLFCHKSQTPDKGVEHQISNEVYANYLPLARQNQSISTNTSQFFQMEYFA